MIHHHHNSDLEDTDSFEVWRDPEAKDSEEDTLEYQAAVLIQKAWRAYWHIQHKKDDEKKTLGWVIYMTMENHKFSRQASMISLIILITIMISILGFCFETLPVLRSAAGFFFVLEVSSTSIFIVEYVVRFAVCHHGPEKERPHWRFFWNASNMCDLLAISPLFLELAFAGGKTKLLKILRAVRLTRLLRIFKLNKYASGFMMMVTALSNSAHILVVLVFFMIMGMVLFSACMYYGEMMDCPIFDAEKGTFKTPQNPNAEYDIDTYLQECKDQIRYALITKSIGGTDYQVMGKTYPLGYAPTSGYLCCTPFGAPTDFPDVASTFWWAIVTLTSVGYGVKRPRGWIGMLVGTLCAGSGVLIIAVPLAIVARKLHDVYEEFRRNDASRAKSKKDESFTKFKAFLQRFPSKFKCELAKIEDRDLEPLDFMARMKFDDERIQRLMLRLSVLWDEHDQHLAGHHRIMQFQFSKQVALKAQMEYVCDVNI